MGGLAGSGGESEFFSLSQVQLAGHTCVTVPAQYRFPYTVLQVLVQYNCEVLPDVLQPLEQYKYSVLPWGLGILSQ